MAQAVPIPCRQNRQANQQRHDPHPQPHNAPLDGNSTSKRAYRAFSNACSRCSPHAGNLRASAASDTLTGCGIARVRHRLSAARMTGLGEDEFAVKGWKAIAPVGLLSIGLVLASGVLAQQQPAPVPDAPTPQAPPPLPGVSGGITPGSRRRRSSHNPRLGLRPRARKRLPNSRPRLPASSPPPSPSLNRRPLLPSKAPARWRISLCRSTSSRFRSP